MEYLLTGEEMKRCDSETIRRFGVPSMVLMERAALACAQVLLEREEKLREAVRHAGFPGAGKTGKEAQKSRILIAAGCGNNGGDGLAVGRLLAQAGFPVDFVLVGKREKCSAETAQQLAIVENYGWTVQDSLPQREYDVIVDALFGIGLHSELREPYAGAVEYINRQNAYVLSVDIPSGIHADTGRVCGCAVRADVTVTFAFWKRGLLLYPGAGYAGQVLKREIGITEEGFSGKLPLAFTYTEPAGELLPARDVSGNKGTFGKVLLIAGSRGMAGAAVLAAEAVLRSGAGMVRVLTEEGNRIILQTAVPEAMLTCYREEALSGADGASEREEEPPGLAPEALAQALAWADVVAAGPGMGTGKTADRLLKAVLRESRKPLVVDADAINLLAADSGLLEELAGYQAQEENYRELIFTPHPGELGRLGGRTVDELLEDPFFVCGEWAARLHAAFLCKGARTVVGSPDGRCYVNRSGNSGMATAGSGDVLTGILAGLLAQGMTAFEAACAGVYLHGCAGDAAAHSRSEYSMTAQDLVRELDGLMRERRTISCERSR